MNILQLTNYSGFQVNKYSPGNVLASTGLAEEGVETVITPSDGLVRWHLAVGLNAMFQAVQFPAGITNLDSSLANVDRDTLTLQRQKRKQVRTQEEITQLKNIEHCHTGSL